MFDLEKAISEWRRQMLAEGLKDADTLDELESHLRDDVDQQMSSGVAAQAAFEAAVGRIGAAGQLRGEFAKEAVWSESRLRELKIVLFAVLAGIAVACAYRAIGIDSNLVLTASGLVTSGLILLCERIWRQLRRSGLLATDEIDLQLLAPSTQMTLELARVEAGRFHHNFVGTEHLLLGLMQSGDDVTSKVMQKLGLDLERVRKKIEDVMGKDIVQPVATGQPCTPRAKRALRLAVSEARALKHESAGTTHLLLGLLLEGSGVAALVLNALGVNPATAREAVLSELGRANQ